MNPGKSDEEFVAQMLGDIQQIAHNKALFEIVRAICNHVGIENLNGFSVEEFFHRRRRERAEKLVADLADDLPAFATQIKRFWEQLDRNSGEGLGD